MLGRCTRCEPKVPGLCSQKHIRLVQTLVIGITLEVLPLRVNSQALGFLPPLEAVLWPHHRDAVQHSLRFLLNLSDAIKPSTSQPALHVWEESEVADIEVRWVGWARNSDHLGFGQKNVARRALCELLRHHGESSSPAQPTSADVSVFLSSLSRFSRLM